MKTLKVLTFSVVILLAANLCYAGDWAIERNGSDVTMRERYNYDYSKQYRGSIDNSGDVRMRNYSGDTLRGNIDNQGYGRVRDYNGNSYRVTPR
ncbi:MAG: hypothetical protein SFH39_18610 [Candidatus Magnetobacterium sp. LHC-1]